MTVIDPDRLAAIKDIPLSTGAHDAPADGCLPGAFCVMEKLSYITHQEWTDHPANCCPTIGALLWSFNDKTDQAGRDLIDAWVLANAERIVKTADDGHRQARGYLAADWSIRVQLPVWLEIAGATEAAATVRALPEITDAKTAKANRDVVREIREKLDLSGARKRLQKKVRTAVKERLGDSAYADAAVYAADAAVYAADAAVYAADADAYDDAAAESPSVWDAVYNAVKTKVTETLDAKRAEHGAVPIKDSAIELLEQLVSVGHQTAEAAA